MEKIEKGKITNMEVNSHSLAYELLQESKKRSKRDFITIIILIILLFASNVGWIIFINQYELTEEVSTIEQEQTNTYNSSMDGVIN